MKHLILSRLKESNKPVKKRELILYVESILNEKVSEREARKAIEELIQDGELIESSEKGHQLITSFEQCQRARDYLNQMIEALAIRRNTLLKNWNARNPNIQIDLFHGQAI